MNHIHSSNCAASRNNTWLFQPQLNVNEECVHLELNKLQVQSLRYWLSYELRVNILVAPGLWASPNVTPGNIGHYKCFTVSQFPVVPLVRSLEGKLILNGERGCGWGGHPIVVIEWRDCTVLSHFCLHFTFHYNLNSCQMWRQNGNAPTQSYRW